MATVERLTIDRFVEVTKAHLLAHRRIVPSVIIRLHNGETAAAMIDPRLCVEGRVTAYGLAGTELAKEVFPRAPDLIIICYEGWMTRIKGQRPEEAADRRQCVLFSTYEADPERLTARRAGLIYEVIRKGGVDLVHRPDLSRSEERMLGDGYNSDIVDPLMSAFSDKFLAEQTRLKGGTGRG